MDELECKHVVERIYQQYIKLQLAACEFNLKLYLLVSNDVYFMLTHYYAAMIGIVTSYAPKDTPLMFLGMPLVRFVALSSPDNLPNIAQVCAVTVDQFKALERYFIRG